MTRHPEQDVVEERLRRNGFRWTNQRRLIVRTALSAHDHFTAEDLLERCRRADPRVSRATVYRTLQVLADAGFVEGLDTGDGGRQYEHVIGHGHHDHMLCTSCRRIFEFHDEELERRQEAAARRIGFRIERHSLRIHGTCRDCARGKEVAR